MRINAIVVLTFLLFIPQPVKAGGDNNENRSEEIIIKKGKKSESKEVIVIEDESSQMTVEYGKKGKIKSGILKKNILSTH